MDVLRDVGDAPRAVALRQLQQILAVKADGAAGRGAYAEDVFEKRGFAGAVLAEQYTDLAVAQFEVDPIENGRRAPGIAEAQIFYFQHTPSSFFEKMTATKKGAPSREVIAPTGSAEPLPILRESVSASRSSRLPQSAETGME